MDKYRDKDWRREKSTKIKKCHDCKKKIEIDKEYYVWFELHSNLSASGFERCINCHEEKLSTVANSYISQVAKLWEDLGDKELDINDLKKIKELDKNISKLLKGCKDIKDNLDDNSLIFTLENLETIPADLNQHIKEYASPQTKDKLQGKDRVCRHLLHGVEQNNGIYRCVYCWDSKSEEFLKVLEKKGIKQENNKPRERESKKSNAYSNALES
ncbi:MAG: hypothetical protein mread185_000217 [Mycoplasmataceae bacterium]|nr:MAG: hypothetical protein mread185_000217 [Mycoplasmataceae bacterium]